LIPRRTALNTLRDLHVFRNYITMQQRFRIIGISGSLRRGSANTAVLRAIQEALTTADMELFRLNEIPAYNEDEDGASSCAPVRALRETIAAADAVILASPEYNHGMPGVLKNALDWLSRPHGASALKDKPVLNITASPAFTGGVRAHQQINETLASMGAHTVIRPQIVIGAVHQKLSENRLTDAATLGFVLAGVEDLLREAAAMRLRTAA
jgi:chromate reductase, NAD(P)H dehydrogenase (quinone)